MNKFKVGDKVRVIVRGGSYEHVFEVGTKGVVSKAVDGGEDVHVHAFYPTTEHFITQILRYDEVELINE